MSATSKTEQWLEKTIQVATWSKDLDLQDRVGCVIVDGNNLVSWGWNHTLDGTCMRDAAGKARPFVVHAETAAIQDALIDMDSGTYTSRLTAYCSKEPCLHCLVQLAHAGVREVHFIDSVPEPKSGKQYLKHFPSIEIYKHHADQLPKLLRALGVGSGISPEPATSTQA